MSNIIASLVAKISADTTGLQTGLNQAKQQLDSFGAAAKGGSFAGDTLGASFNSAAAASTGAAKAYATQGASLAGMVSQYRSALGYLTVAGAVIAGGKAIYEMGKMGAEIGYTADKFDRLAASAGTSGDVLLKQLDLASKGTQTDFQLMKQGSDLFQLGLADNASEAIRFSTVMTALGMDTGELVLAVANQSKRRLDQLGISLKDFNKNEAMYKAMGLSKEDAFKQAFLTTAEQTVEKVGNKAEGATGSYDRLTASFGNFTDSMKTSLASTFLPVNDAMSKFWDKATLTNKAVSTFAEYQKTASTRSFADIWSAKFSGKEAIGSGALSEYLNQDSLLRPGSKQYNDRALEYYQQQQQVAQYQATSAGGYGLEAQYAAPHLPTQAAAAINAAAAPQDYGFLIDSGLKLTSVQEKYNETLNKLAEKMIDAPQKYGLTADQAANLTNNLTDLNGVTSEYNATLQTQLANLTAAGGEYGKNAAQIREVREGLSGLQKAGVDTGNTLMMSSLQSKDATEEQQLSYARASGMMSEQAYQQAMALSKISDAFIANKLNADEAAAATKGVMSGLTSINGFNAVGYVDIYIRYHGGGVSAQGANVGAVAVENTFSNQLVLRRALGGPVSPGSMYSITEYGDPEILNAGGKSYLLTGKDGGQVAPMSGRQRGGGAGPGQDQALLMSVVSRIPSAEDNAKALAKELAKMY